MPGAQLRLIAGEEDYEVSLPEYWSKRPLLDGNWILYSTKAPETLRIRVLIPADGRPVENIELAAKSTADSLGSGMTTHNLIRSGWDGATFSIIGAGSSLPHKALLAYRVMVNDKKIVWALPQLSLESAPHTDQPAPSRSTPQRTIASIFSSR